MKGFAAFMGENIKLFTNNIRIYINITRSHNFILYLALIRNFGYSKFRLVEFYYNSCVQDLVPALKSDPNN